MNAEVTLRTKGCADHLRMFWQAAESLLELIPFENDAAQTRFNLLVSIQEAVSNILRHGYSESDVPEVQLKLSWDANDLTIEMRDCASAFDPTQVWAVPDTSDALAIPEGGYGIHMMREVLDALEYHRDEDENVLTMRKSVARVRSEV